jgi:glucokinase
MQVLALDIGGSSVKHGIVEVSGRTATLVRAARSERLPSTDFSDLRRIVMNLVAQTLDQQRSVSTVGISTTGSVDADGVVVRAGHFKDYRNVSWSKLIGDEFGHIKRVATINDGQASAWAEFNAGPREAGSRIHVVVGTGVGGGVVHNGDLILGGSGQAGYIGHIKIAIDSTLRCSCGSTGCVETLAAAPAIVRYFQEQSPGTQTEVLRLEEVTARACDGAAPAVDAFEHAGYWLGLGLGNAMNVLNPSVVSVGGGVLLASESIGRTNDGGPFMSGVARGVEAAAHRRVRASAQMLVARLGNDGGLIGAALLACLS